MLACSQYNGVFEAGIQEAVLPASECATTLNICQSGFNGKLKLLPKWKRRCRSLIPVSLDQFCLSHSPGSSGSHPSPLLGILFTDMVKAKQFITPYSFTNPPHPNKQAGRTSSCQSTVLQKANAFVLPSSK